MDKRDLALKPSHFQSFCQHFCLSNVGLMQLVFILFGFGFTALVLFSFLLDWLHAYPMCEICLLQRFVMTLLGLVALVGAASVRRIHGLGVTCFLAIGLLLGLGLGFAVSHVYMIAVAAPSGNAHACKMVAEMTFIPDFWYDFFHSRYAFVSCDQVTSGFLGLSFPLWSLLIYSCSATLFAIVSSLMIRSFFVEKGVTIKDSVVFQVVKAVILFIVVVFFCVWMAASMYFVTVQRKILYKPDRYDVSHEQSFKKVDMIAYAIPEGKQWAFAYPRSGTWTQAVDTAKIQTVSPTAAVVAKSNTQAVAKSSTQAVATSKHAVVKKRHHDLWIVLWGRDTMALDALFSDPAWIGVFNQLSGSGSQFLLIDYPGFGMNAGFPGERSNRDSVLAAYRAWRHYKGIADDETVRVFLLAHSMGTGVAVDAARSLQDISGVVLLSPFVSIFQMSKVLLGSWMAWTVRPFLLDRYPTDHRLHSLHEQFPQLPVAIFHGDADYVIPVTHSQYMAKSHAWIQYHERAGIGHNKRDFADAKVLAVMQSMMRHA